MNKKFIARKTHQFNKLTILMFGLLSIAISVFLSSSIFAQTQSDSLKELGRRIEILTQEIERIQLGEVQDIGLSVNTGFGPAASKVYQQKKSGVSIAGYGEILFQNFAENREDGKPSKKINTIDFLRNVIYVGYRFSEQIVFNSEIEFEHATTGEGAEEKGEVSVEFGYVDMLISKNVNLRSGLLLVPMGIINLKHEPSTYFGTLRPQVEQIILPSTWRAIGFGSYGEIIAGLNYHLYITEGLNASEFSDAKGFREGRQSGSEALMDNLSASGRLEFEPFAGLTIGASFFAGKSGQGLQDSIDEINAGTTLLSAHGELNWQGFEFRALFVRTSLNQADRLSALTGKPIGSVMNGWYATLGYDVVPLFFDGSAHIIAPYVQYEKFNTQAKVADGFLASNANDRSILTLGLMYKPHASVAFKVDYRNNSNAATTGIHQWNVALNYLF